MYLPHPYARGKGGSGRYAEELVPLVDVVEVFNGRLHPGSLNKPGEEFAVHALLRQVETMEIVAASISVDQMFDELVQRGALLQFDHSVRPTMYRCCTVTVAELDEQRRIHNVVRMGRVQKIGLDRIDLDHGTIPTSSETVHVDCTADGLANRPVRPISVSYTHLTLPTILLV